MLIRIVILTTFLIATAKLLAATEFQCTVGREVNANLDGNLHGKFTSWNDEGVIIISGNSCRALTRG